MKYGRCAPRQPSRLLSLVCAIIMCLGISARGKQTTDGIDLYKAVVIDAGSTGTRVHMYNYKILDEEKGINIHIPSISYKTTPGFVYLLNNYFGNDEKVPFYEYFKNIKEFLYEHVQVKERSRTPIIIRASGGFRLLSITESEKYINFVKQYFLNNFSDFLLIDELLIKVLSGKEEAILSFVSIYALLEKFNPSPVTFTNLGKSNGENAAITSEVQKGEDSQENKFTELTQGKTSQNGENDIIGVLELGGATAQVVMKFPLSKMNEDIKNIFNYKHREKVNKSVIEENYKNKNIVKIPLFDDDIYLYCKSYLVLGRQNAMKTYLHYIIHEHNAKEKVGGKDSRVAVAAQKNASDKTKFIPVACFPKNFKFYVTNLYETSIEEELHEYDGKMEMSEYDYVAEGTGDIDLCRSQIQTILNHAEIDDLPFKLKRFIKLYGIENFHHFAIDILNLPEGFNPIALNSNMYLEKAKEVCPLTIDEIVKVVRPEANIEKAQTSCFGLIFLYEFMRYVLKIEEPIAFHSTNYINRISITWTVAVLLMELPPHLQTIKKQTREPYHNDEL
ncbi:ectonucleoside triphosphate diphosphohydrolase 5/6 [Plasmodium inui San Antonio 1]|uniref:Ectonucleoside triphosphate diphosphohydrolase 5/6 n=1 Tax=Plasmodium inui San Antonio 1 TaxID=1237626 RepID=W7A7M7_9APIC|nr:ectonucleoside triphosphate diphosphohydrolase 5/6 [Plasmodium inui San Antonio 1]EUD69177.1 ectonucleoside triphosphate diphosphohydrolase 5/6 [Plasmodium inui San Antonio 1]